MVIALCDPSLLARKLFPTASSWVIRGRATLLALALLPTSNACRSDASSDAEPEIRIGVLTALAGTRLHTSGRSTVEAIELAARVVNDEGGLSVRGVPHKVVVVVKDTEIGPDAATSAARELVNQRRVHALVGPQISQRAIPVANLAEQAGVPMISPMSSHELTTADKNFVFRINFLNEYQGRVIASLAQDELGFSSAAVLYDVSEPYSQALAEVFHSAFEKAGGRVVAYESFTSDTANDFGSQLARIRDAHPDVLFLPNYTSIVALQIPAARAQGIDAVFLGSDTWDPVLIAAVPEAKGAFFVHQWHPDITTPETASFVELYRRTYGDVPKITAAVTYDSVQLLFRAIQSRGDIDPESIRAGIAETSSYIGVTGRIGFHGSGDPERSAVILRIEDERAVVHAIVDP